MTTETPAGASDEVDQIPRRQLPFWVALALSVALVGPTLAMSGNGQGLIGTVGKSIPLVFLIGLVRRIAGRLQLRPADPASQPRRVVVRPCRRNHRAEGRVLRRLRDARRVLGVLHRHAGADRGVHQRVHRRTAARQRKPVPGAVGGDRGDRRRRVVPSLRPRHQAAGQGPAGHRGPRHPGHGHSRRGDLRERRCAVDGHRLLGVLLLRRRRHAICGARRRRRGVPVMGGFRGVRIDG